MRNVLVVVVVALAVGGAAGGVPRAAVVFSGHPRTFLSEARVRANVYELGVAPLCADVACDVFALAARSDASLFGSAAASGRRATFPDASGAAVAAAMAGWDAGDAGAAGSVRVAAVGDVANPPPAAAREGCAFGDAAAAGEAARPAAHYGYELAQAFSAWSLVLDAERAAGETYDLVARLRFDAVWVRRAPGALALLGAPRGAPVRGLRVAVVPRHHFPVNNHAAVVGRGAAAAYFEGPLALWRNCSARWGPPPPALDNPEGVLLRSLLDAGVAVRRAFGLFATVYRADGAECARFKAYRRGDGRTVASECARLFPVADPASSRTPRRADDFALVYRFHDMVDESGAAVELTLRTVNWRAAVAAACETAVPRDPDLCAVHLAELEYLRRSLCL